jgi:serine/threonine-protein kinase
MSHEETVFTQRSNARIPAGMVLNNTFQVDSWISSGGMGEIYKGHSVQTGDLLAIKLIRPEMAENDTVLALFRKEASVLHNLLHEAIVRYYVFSEDPTLRRPYLVMEFVDGPSLADVIRAGPLPYESVRVLQRRLATALQSAHDLGIVHRDISPDNVILPAGDVKRAKIIDFGIAKAANIGDTIIGGGFAGKHKYVSPEQLGLFGGEVTPKSDAYSLGLVLAEALTGRAADMGNTQVEMDAAAVPQDLCRSMPASAAHLKHGSASHDQPVRTEIAGGSGGRPRAPPLQLALRPSWCGGGEASARLSFVRACGLVIGGLAL